MKVGVLLVVHGEAPNLGSTLSSIREQSRPPDIGLGILDSVTDDVRARLVAEHFLTTDSTSTATDPFTRIAQNFHQGIRQLSDCDVVVLGDHDDVWRHQRVERQSRILDEGEWWMTAGDGAIIDESGAVSAHTLRSTFPVPGRWNGESPWRNIRYALRHSIATGGASAVRPTYFAQKPIPHGWLHDRWWSLIATKKARMHLDDDVVINYRVQPNQQVGLFSAGQDHHARWALRRLRDVPSAVQRAQDLLVRG